MHLEDHRAEDIRAAMPAWREGVNFDVIRAKLRQRRRAVIWFGMLGAVTCVALVALYVFVRTPIYSASAEVLVENTTLQVSGPDAVVTQLLTENSLILSEMELVRSSEVLKRVVDGSGVADVGNLLPTGTALSFLRLGLRDRSPTPEHQTRRQETLLALKANIAVSRVGATQIIAVTTKAKTAEGAALLANEVVNAFVSDQNEANAVITTSPLLRERIKMVGPTLRVISTAKAPNGPNGPSSLLLLLLSLLTGGILGTAVRLAFVLIDRRLVCAEQIALITSVECFGCVPRLRIKRGDRNHLVGRAQHRNPSLSKLTDVLRRVRLATVERAGGNNFFVGVTSCQGGEGKSTISKYLAQLIAADGRRVLLIDAADGSKLTRDLATGARQGLMDVLRGKASLSEVIWPDINPFLDFMPQGVTGSDIDMRWPALPDLLLNRDQRAAEWVILDLPALAPLVDVRAAAQGLNSILLIVRWGRTRERQLQEALRALGPARAKLLGVIINRPPKWRSITPLPRALPIVVSAALPRTELHKV